MDAYVPTSNNLVVAEQNDKSMAEHLFREYNALNHVYFLLIRRISQHTISSFYRSSKMEICGLLPIIANTPASIL